MFADGDPWSYRIYGSVAYGSIKSAHLSEYLATPEADYIGIQPADIVEYDLPTDPSRTRTRTPSRANSRTPVPDRLLGRTDRVATRDREEVRTAVAGLPRVGFRDGYVSPRASGCDGRDLAHEPRVRSVTGTVRFGSQLPMSPVDSGPDSSRAEEVAFPTESRTPVGRVRWERTETTSTFSFTPLGVRRPLDVAELVGRTHEPGRGRRPD